MPPVVTGAVVAVIGLNLASVPVKNMAASNFDSWMQVVTFVCVGLVAVFTSGLMQRVLILVGLVAATVIYALLTNVLGLGKAMELSGIAAAAWFGMPNFAVPVFDPKAMLMIAPVAIILVAENLGHIKAVTAMTGIQVFGVQTGSWHPKGTSCGALSPGRHLLWINWPYGAISA